MLTKCDKGRNGRQKKVTQTPLPVSPELAAVLQEHSAGRAPHEPLLEPFEKLYEDFRQIGGSVRSRCHRLSARLRAAWEAHRCQRHRPHRHANYVRV
jgi:hypothetical protein